MNWDHIIETRLQQAVLSQPVNDPIAQEARDSILREKTLRRGDDPLLRLAYLGENASIPTLFEGVNISTPEPEYPEGLVETEETRKHEAIADLQVRHKATKRVPAHRSSLGRGTAAKWFAQVQESTRGVYLQAYRDALKWCQKKGIPTNQQKTICERIGRENAGEFLEGQWDLLEKLGNGVREQHRALLEDRNLNPVQREVLGEKIAERFQTLVFLFDCLETFSLEVNPETPIPENPIAINSGGRIVHYYPSRRELDIEVDGAGKGDTPEERDDWEALYAKALNGEAEIHFDPDEVEMTDDLTRPVELWRDSGPYYDPKMEAQAEELLEKVRNAPTVRNLQGLTKWARFLAFARRQRQQGHPWQLPGLNARESHEKILHAENKVRKAVRFCEKLDWLPSNITEERRMELVLGANAKLFRMCRWLEWAKEQKLPAGITYRYFAEASNLIAYRTLELQEKLWITSERSGGSISGEVDESLFDLLKIEVDNPDEIQKAKEERQWVVDALREHLPTWCHVHLVISRWGHKATVQEYLDGEEPPRESDALGAPKGDLIKAENQAYESPFEGSTWEPDPEEKQENTQRASIRYAQIEDYFQQAKNFVSCQYGDIERMPVIGDNYRSQWSKSIVHVDSDGTVTFELKKPVWVVTLRRLS